MNIILRTAPASFARPESVRIAAILIRTKESVAFAHKHLPKSANWDVFTREYLLDDVTEWTTERLIDEYKSNSGIWDTKVLQEICKRADMLDEWEEADGETFERVVQLAVFTLEEG